MRHAYPQKVRDRFEPVPSIVDVRAIGGLTVPCRHPVGKQPDEEKSSTTMHSFPILDSIALACRTGDRLSINSALEQLGGYSATEISTVDDWFRLFHGEFAAALQAKYELGRVAAFPHKQIIYVRRKDGQYRYWEITAYLDDTHELWLIRELSDQTQVAAIEQRKEASLRQAQKMEAIGQLASGVAHDFNNLLTVISGTSELLLDRSKLSSSDRDAVETILLTAQQASGLTRQLLAFSRKSTLQPEVIDLTIVLRELERMLDRLLGAKIRMRLSMPAQPVWAFVDRSQMEQIVMNLVINARDAMPNGGLIQVELAHITHDGTLGSVDLRPGEYVTLSVLDTGIGIPTEVLPRIFEPFFTTKSEDVGTGMGLATVYGLVMQSHGHIEVESCLGKGSQFRVYLPRYDAPHGTPRAEIRPTPSPLSAREVRVLVVDDDEAVRALTVRILAQRGYHSISVESAMDALQQMQEVTAGHVPPIDLMITDMIMPGMSGRELTDRVLAGWPDVRILCMSGCGADELSEIGGVTPGIDFLAKPFSLPGMLDKVKSLLEN